MASKAIWCSVRSRSMRVREPCAACISRCAPHLEAKIVRCTRGAIFDVMVDLREGSPTYGQWHGEELTADNRPDALYSEGLRAWLSEPGRQHRGRLRDHPGLCAAEAAAGFRFDDPALAIDWPVAEMVVSERDKALPPSFAGILL